MGSRIKYKYLYETYLPYVLEYIYTYIGQIAKRRKRPVLAFNMQNATKHSTWSGTVFSRA